jgi:hypothetical protein
MNRGTGLPPQRGANVSPNILNAAQISTEAAAAKILHQTGKDRKKEDRSNS